ncbi:polyprenyl synthetase family protein [Paenibacillus sp. alder61]|uniref:Polyprenyl synthetase family protein n=1 Tax=Paenibacillus faecis TaxID=862114 RepID=A0A5D0CNV5_9BACL|nr:MULTISPECIES: polyprenyl synthetase family protein [Paenibacillus]MCA1292557.1 polyprenyl synthetase family protein [Paenibacillus sp. alder61]TYA11606.1 polyprenyl synthetase family protein [Paenibacillus faecis]
MKPQLTLDEALDISLRSVDREIENMVKYDKDIPRSSALGKSIVELVRSGGKRVRPLMVIVGSRFGPSPDRRKVWRLAAAAEFIHAASLIHDDIIDDSPVRRGQPAMHIKLGVSGALHVGNYMSARVIELLSVYSAERERYVYDLSSLATTQLCLGEYQQLSHLFDYDVTIDEYLEKSRNKTAQLMATCLKIGAQSAGAEENIAELLYSFGEKLGMAFQIRDDLLDFTQSAEQLGKPAGSDLRKGQVTLPVLFALRDKRLAPAIRAIGPDTPAEVTDAVIGKIQQSGALDESERLGRRYLDEAESIINRLRTFPAHRDLQTLLHYFGGRES